jgi:peptidoglycan/xylan/chitin deacetylase (PgdA/CDA1 family)
MCRWERDTGIGSEIIVGHAVSSRRLVNLTFHGVGRPARAVSEGEGLYWLKEDLFLHVLDRIAEREDVRLSFDDGNPSDVEIAVPALLERGLEASFFIVGGRIGEPGFLTRAGVRALAESGMTVGSHGMHHRSWRRMTPPDLDAEINASRALLEDIVERPVELAACPFGHYDRAALRALRRAGYQRVFTSDGGSVRPGSWLQPRNSLRRSDAQDVLDRILRAEPASTLLTEDIKLLVRRWR